MKALHVTNHVIKYVNIVTEVTNANEYKHKVTSGQFRKK